MPHPKHPPFTSWEDMPIDEFRKRHALAKQKSEAFVNDMRELFPGLVTLTKEQRAHAPRLRDGALPMFLKVLDVTALKPALFESLADADEGTDPNKFETELLRDRVEKRKLFSDLEETLAPISGAVGDTGHYLAGRFYDAVMAAYRIAKTHAATDKAINDILAPVIDFMREGAVAAAATRAAKKNEKAGK